MLQNSKKTIVLLFVPISLYALSVADFLSFFKTQTANSEPIEPRTESLQNMKVLEPVKFVADNFLDENSTSLEVHREFTDDFSVGPLENYGENAIYTVQAGDSINTIAAYFGVSVETIMAFNHKTNRTVHVGDVLEVPSVNGINYTVKKGDTLAKISKKYNISLDDLTLFTGLQEDEVLSVGDEIFLPNAKDTDVVKQTTTITKTINKLVSKSTYVKDVAVSRSQHWERGDTAHLNTPAAIAKYSGQPKYDGYYLFPAPGATRTQKMHGNNGCDLANKIGSPVLASADGIVTVAKTGSYNFGYGNYIKIKHSNGTETLYGHLSRVDVSVGQAVSRGEQIGAVGSTGNSTGPHLHFEIHGAYNPFAW